MHEECAKKHGTPGGGDELESCVFRQLERLVEMEVGTEKVDSYIDM